MTQVLALMTHDYVLLAADRRVCVVDPKRLDKGVLVREDEHCKMVCLCSRASIAYSGLAEIRKVATDKWMGSRLADAGSVDPRNAADVIRDQATLQFRKLRDHHPHYPNSIWRHTFAMVGWGGFTDSPGLRPLICVISNHLDVSGRELDYRRDNFEWNVYRLREQELFRFFAAGEQLRRRDYFAKSVYGLLKETADPARVLQRLVDEIVFTSQWQKLKGKQPTVGHNVLGLCIPRKGAERMPAIVFPGLPESEYSTYSYFRMVFIERNNSTALRWCAQGPPLQMFK